MVNLFPIVQVVPLKRLPRRLTVFDYSAGPLQLNPGDLVNLPFRSSLIKAVVVKKIIKSSLPKNKTLKEVKDLVVANYLFSWQLHLVKWLSHNYGLTMSAAIKLFILLQPNRNFKIEPISTKRTRPLIKKTNSFLTNLVYSSPSKLDEVVFNLLNRIMLRQEQVLFLVPTNSRLEFWQEKLKDKFSLVVFSSEISLADRRAVWLKLRRGDKVVVVGTRLALFLPFLNLGGLVVDESASDYYKQSDQNPRYDPVSLAIELAKNLSVSCLLLSTAPRLERWYKAQAGQEKWLDLKGQPAELTLIDMIAEHQAGNKNLLSLTSLKLLEKSLKTGQSVFVYLNRLGEATSAVCTDCGYVAKCSKCQRTLVSRSDKNNLYCYHCSLEEVYPLPCPDCSGNNVAMRGVGLDRLYQFVKKLYPASIVFKDSLSDKAPVGPVVLVGGQTAWLNNQKTKFGLIILVNPDNEMSVPEFRATERLRHRVAGFLSSGATRVLIQTYQPEHYVWQSFIKKEGLTYFYETELKERIKYGYPPVSNLLRLTVALTSQAAALASCRVLKKKLQTNLLNQEVIIGPYADYYHQLRGKYRFHLLVKFTTSSVGRLIWPLVGDDVIIDIDPENILS
ncbi:primosomal protein N' [Patescibacteria group bacterium]|nr:primosomal protein N' [Patescibacteria group bacterium]